MSKKKMVKLVVYEEAPDYTIIETYETESFSEFMIVRVDVSSPDEADRIKRVFEDIAPDRKVVIVPNGIPVSVYGVMEDNDSRHPGSKLQHERHVDQTAGDAEF